MPVTFLDVDAVVARLRGAAERLRRGDPNVEAVILFGSLAQGTATPSSDADLLLVLADDRRRRVLDRVPEYARWFEGLGCGVEVFPWTRAELAQRLREGDSFAGEIVRTGRVLAGRSELLQSVGIA